MSRMTALFLLATATATPPSAERMAQHYHAMTTVTPSRRCLPARGEEVVVCGTRDERERQRLPLPEERAAPDGARRDSGERPAASAAAVRQGGCGVADRGQICSSGFEGKKAADAIVRVIRTMVDPDGIAEPEQFRTRAGLGREHPGTALNPK